jgi:hypothetical protein
MISAAVITRLRLGAIALAAALTLGAAPFADAHGGGHGGGGGGHGFGGRGFGGHRFDGHGGFGRRGFGYGGFGFYDGFGLLGYGLLFDSLPLYYSTYWWGGVPYYYASDNFYQWNGSAGHYETVRPPQSLANQVATGTEDLNLFAYPKNGQTTAQQTIDRSECQQWATGQTGIESLPVGSTAAVAVPASKRQDYLRAQAACLQGRGYSVQ